MEINTLDIDTQRDMDRFDEDVEVDDNLSKMIVNVFRFKNNDDITYGRWYYTIIQMYKNILGNDICDFKLIKIKAPNRNGKQIMSYHQNLQHILLTYVH